MKFYFNSKNASKETTHLITAASSEKEKVNFLSVCKDTKKMLQSHPLSKDYKAGLGEVLSLTNETHKVVVFGLGDQKDLTSEKLRRNFAKVLKPLLKKNLMIDVDSFSKKHKGQKGLEILLEALMLSDYSFSKYKSKDKKDKKKESSMHILSDKLTPAKFKSSLERIEAISSSVHVCRDFVNEAPNVLHSEEYAKLIEKDVKENLKGCGVKVKILKKSEIKKEKMNLFLSVNAGSAYEPRLVHLTYTPKKANKKTKHVAVVGKGITFDTGGYSLKPSGSMIGMKFDMGGSATLYGAFRSAVLQKSKNKITCVLAMTDNAVNSLATMPDSIVKGRNGKTVEILNTDAEGRLILADALDYTCDLKPDEIIDAATLTGACLVAFGIEVCALLGNDQKMMNNLLKSAKEADEYLWQLPLIDEYRDQMKSKIADLKNIGKARMAGTATAAAFLENFIKNDISWSHLDIAGVCDSQVHLPYCPTNGASGVMVRTVSHYLMS